jgi:hypothetical protein
LLGLTSDKHTSDEGQMNVQRKPDDGRTEVKWTSDGKAGRHNSRTRDNTTHDVAWQDSRTHDVG